MGWAERRPPLVPRRLKPGPTGRVKPAFVGDRVGQGTVVTTVGAHAGFDVVYVDSAAAAAAAAVGHVATPWPPAAPRALKSAERPVGAKRGNAVMTLVPPPALVPALLLAASARS